jgi:uncharacterized protein
MAGGSDKQALAPACRVKVNGTELPSDAAADLLRVEVEEDIDQPDMFILQMINWDMHKRKVTWVDDEMFSVGAEVSIEMGYVDHLQRIMLGELTGLEPVFSSGGVPLATMRGFDVRHRLMRGRKSQTFLSMKDSDIFSKIVGNYGLTAQADDSSITNDHVYQHNQTDWEFLKRRASRIDFEITADDKTLHFRKRQHATSKAFTLDREQDLLKLSVRLSSMNMVTTVKVRAWDAKTKQEVIGSATAGDESTKMGGASTGPQASDKAFGQTDWVDVDEPVSSQAEADAIAKAILEDRGLQYITGEGEAIGRNDLRSGTVVKIENLGDKFTGLYYIIGTIHKFSPRLGYRTIFKVRRNAS